MFQSSFLFILSCPWYFMLLNVLLATHFDKKVLPIVIFLVSPGCSIGQSFVSALRTTCMHLVPVNWFLKMKKTWQRQIFPCLNLMYIKKKFISSSKLYASPLLWFFIFFYSTHTHTLVKEIEVWFYIMRIRWLPFRSFHEIKLNVYIQLNTKLHVWFFVKCSCICIS